MGSTKIFHQPNINFQNPIKPQTYKERKKKKMNEAILTTQQCIPRKYKTSFKKKGKKERKKPRDERGQK